MPCAPHASWVAPRGARSRADGDELVSPLFGSSPARVPAAGDGEGTICLATEFF